MIKLLLALLLLTTPAFATQYYVSNAGADTANGTSVGTPWAHAPGMTGCSNTCNSVTINAGDIISLRAGDSWTSTTMTMKTAGASGNNITLNSYGAGALPIISAAINNPAITVTAASRGYWTIDGLDLRSTGNPVGIANSLALYFNYWPSENGPVPGWIIQNCTFNAGAFVSGPNTTVRNNTFDGTGNALNIRAAITVRGPNADGILIEGNSIANWGSRGIWILNGNNGATVRNNIVHDITAGDQSEGMCVDHDGYDVPNYNSQTYGNTIYNCAFSGLSFENTFNAQAYQNTIHDTQFGSISSLNYAAHSATADYRGVASNSVVYSNLVYNSVYGVFIQDCSYWTYDHNTFVRASSNGFFIGGSPSVYNNNLTYTNNIIAGSTTPISVPDSAAVWTQLDYNITVPNGTTVLVQRVGGNKTLAQLQALGLMTNGSTADPKLASQSSTIPDFRLQAKSPAINAGVASSVTVDFVGNAIRDLPDIGAYEFSGRTVTATARTPVTRSAAASRPVVAGSRPVVP